MNVRTLTQVAYPLFLNRRTATTTTTKMMTPSTKPRISILPFLALWADFHLPASVLARLLRRCGAPHFTRYRRRSSIQFWNIESDACFSQHGFYGVFVQYFRQI